MATLDDVRAIVSSLPRTICCEPGEPAAHFSVEAKPKPKGIAWSWLERVDPKKARVPRLDVLAIRVASEGEKQSLIAAEPGVYFTEPHYNGYPAVLVRLEKIGIDELSEILTDAWRVMAPRKLVNEFDQATR